MNNGSLFERLTGIFTSSSMDEDEILYQSITNNLANILSSNVGSSQTVPDYGKVDLNNMDLNPKNSQKFIEEELLHSILKYEKRLLNSSVVVLENQYDVSTMYIYVNGMILIQGKHLKVTFKAKIHGDGTIKVE